MSLLTGSVINELEKLFRKKRLLIAVLILTLIQILLGTVAHYTKEDFQTDPNWKSSLEQQVQSLEQQITQVPEDQKAKMQYFLDKSKFQLEHDINPTPGGIPAEMKSSFSTPFLTTILPLMMIIIGADLVASEVAEGTMKSILVRPVGRSYILLGKGIAFFLTGILIMLYSDILTYVIGLIVLEPGDWSALTVIGTTSFTALPLWQYALLALGLNVFSVFVLTCVMLLISVLMRTSATAISISMVLIVVGGLFGSLGSKIDGMKYFFVPHFDLVAHLTNDFPLQNITMGYSVTVLVLTASISLLLAFTIFTKKDMLV